MAGSKGRQAQPIPPTSTGLSRGSIAQRVVLCGELARHYAKYAHTPKVRACPLRFDAVGKHDPLVRTRREEKEEADRHAIGGQEPGVFLREGPRMVAG